MKKSRNDLSIIERFFRYMEETYKNKLVAIGMIVIGALSVFPDNDATALMLMLMIGVPLFFTRKNWIG